MKEWDKLQWIIPFMCLEVLFLFELVLTLGPATVFWLHDAPTFFHSLALNKRSGA